MSLPITGGCRCGAVRYEANAEPAFTGHCQCTDCRAFSGTGHSSHMAVPKAAVSLTGEAKIYDAPADSGNIVGRAFCPDCGAPVYSLNSGMTDLIFLRASSLDDPNVFVPQMVVYTRSGPAWDYLDPNLPAFETMPPRFCRSSVAVAALTASMNF